MKTILKGFLVLTLIAVPFFTLSTPAQALGVYIGDGGYHHHHHHHHHYYHHHY